MVVGEGLNRMVVFQLSVTISITLPTPSACHAHSSSTWTTSTTTATHQAVKRSGIVGSVITIAVVVLGGVRVTLFMCLAAGVDNDFFNISELVL